MSSSSPSSSLSSSPSIDLFIDTLALTISQFQTSITKLLTSNHPLSNKLEDLSLDMLQFKCQIFQMMHKMLSSQSAILSSKGRQDGQSNSNNNGKSNKNGGGLCDGIINRLDKQSKQTMARLKKMELHTFLKKKIRRAQRQSMMNSMQMSMQMSMSRLSSTSNNNNNNNLSTPRSPSPLSSSQLLDPTIQKLKSSMLLIQKDLGLQLQPDTDTHTNIDPLESSIYKSYNKNYNGQHYSNDVSIVVHRSMASLEITPIKSQIQRQRGWLKKDKKDTDTERSRQQVDIDASMNSSVFSMDISIRVQDQVKNKDKDSYPLIENYQVNGQSKPISILQQLKVKDPKKQSSIQKQSQPINKQPSKSKSKQDKSGQIQSTAQKLPIAATAAPKQQSQPPANFTISIPMQKKKKIIVSSTGNNTNTNSNHDKIDNNNPSMKGITNNSSSNSSSNNNKGMFSNLLEQSLQSCNQQKQIQIQNSINNKNSKNQ